MRITIRTSDRSFYSDLKAASIEGIKVSFFTKDSIEPGELLTVIVTSATTVATELFIKWLYHKFRSKPNEKTVINGNQIFVETIQITEITQIVFGEKKNDNKSDGIDR